MCEQLKKHINERITIGQKRGGSVFFIDGVLVAVSDTHVFLKTNVGEQAFLLSEISKIEFRGCV